jgi:hypothetical protein
VAREVRLWEWLRDGLKPVVGLHLRRVENLVGEGDPDVEGCWMGSYFEVELKGCDRPKKGGRLDFEVRQSQVIWHRKRWRCGGNLWVYVRVGRDRATKRYLVPSSSMPILKEGVTEVELAALSCLPPEHSQMDLLHRVIQRWGNRASP